jgi:hypothetical protein
MLPFLDNIEAKELYVQAQESNLLLVFLKSCITAKHDWYIHGAPLSPVVQCLQIFSFLINIHDSIQPIAEPLNTDYSEISVQYM